MTHTANMTWAQIARKAAEGSPLSPRDVYVVIQRLAAVGYGVVPVVADPTESSVDPAKRYAAIAATED